jgi:tetratricopeptide (TPR) repeat protein
LGDNSTICENCGVPAEPEYELHLCTSCREKLVNRPFPVWIKTSAFIVTAIIIFALTRFSIPFNAYVAFEKGRKAETERKYGLAIEEYLKVFEHFPNSTDVIARLGISYYEDGQISKAIETLVLLEGRSTSNKLIDEVNYYIDKINSELEQEE